MSWTKPALGGSNKARVAQPVKFKRRVRAKLDAALPEPRPTRRYLPWVGAAVWLVTVAVCLAVTEDGWPLAGWFGDDARAAQQLTPPPRPPAGWARQSAGALSPYASGRPAPAWGRSSLGVPSSGPGSGQPFRPLAPRLLPRAAADPARPDETAPTVPPPSSAAAGRGDSATRGREERATSCEGAIAAHRHEAMSGQSRGPAKLSFGRHRAIIENGSYLAHCGLPESMQLRVCAAIKHGRARGVTVHSSPLDRRVQGCVAQAVRELEFPTDSRLDVTRAYFSPR